LTTIDALAPASANVAQAGFDDESLWGGDTYSKVYLGLWGAA
jgi:hypothetical protein